MPCFEFSSAVYHSSWGSHVKDASSSREIFFCLGDTTVKMAWLRWTSNSRVLNTSLVFCDVAPGRNMA